MKTKALVFGVGSILREQVDGWGTSDSGTPHVYPDHPPLDLSASSYPRGAIDIIAREPEMSDVTKSVFSGTVLLEITVYAINSGEVYELISDTHQALIDYNDHSDYQFDSDGDPLLENWSFVTDGNVGPIIQESSEKGLTRYNKSIEFEWRAITAKQTT